MRKYRQPSPVTQSTTTRGRQRQGLPCAARQAGERNGGMEAFFFYFSLGSARETTALDETTAARPTLGPGTWPGGQGMALLSNLQFIHSSTSPSQASGVMGRRPRCVPASAKRESQSQSSGQRKA